MDDDWFRVIITTPQSLSVVVSPIGMQLILELYEISNSSSNYTQLASSNTGIINTQVEVQSYFVRVIPTQFVEGWGSYTLTLLSSDEGGGGGGSDITDLTLTSLQSTTYVASTGTSQVISSVSSTDDSSGIIKDQTTGGLTTMESSFLDTTAFNRFNGSLAGDSDFAQLIRYNSAIVGVIGGIFILFVCAVVATVLIVRHKKRQGKHEFYLQPPSIQTAESHSILIGMSYYCIMNDN
jgi:hypothetical protein